MECRQRCVIPPLSCLFRNYDEVIMPFILAYHMYEKEREKLNRDGWLYCFCLFLSLSPSGCDIFDRWKKCPWYCRGRNLLCHLQHLLIQKYQFDKIQVNNRLDYLLGMSYTVDKPIFWYNKVNAGIRRCMRMSSRGIPWSGAGRPLSGANGWSNREKSISRWGCNALHPQF